MYNRSLHTIKLYAHSVYVQSAHIIILTDKCVNIPNYNYRESTISRDALVNERSNIYMKVNRIRGSGTYTYVKRSLSLHLNIIEVGD